MNNCLFCGKKSSSNLKSSDQCFSLDHFFNAIYDDDKLVFYTFIKHSSPDYFLLNNFTTKIFGIYDSGIGYKKFFSSDHEISIDYYMQFIKNHLLLK